MAGYVLQSIAVTSAPGFVLESIAAETPAIAVLHDLDAGNIDPTLTVITGPTASEPDIYVKPRETPSTIGDGHIHWFFALSGATGKRPVITVDNTNRLINSTMVSSWRPSYSYDRYTWYQATAFTALTTPTRVQFQFPDAFTSDTVYIADHPTFQYAHAADLAAELLGDASGLVHVSAEADAFGVIGTSPTENDDIGRAVGGNSMWGFRLEDESATTTDGGPRRELVITHGIHAGEVVDGWYLRGLIDWYLNDASAEAVAFRRNWRVLTYFMLNPNGRKGGDNRGVWRTGEDPNRDWDAPSAFSMAENAYVRDAIIADAARHDVHIDLHSAASASTIPRVFYQDAIPFTRYEAFKAAFDAQDSEDLALIASSVTGTVGEWALNRGCSLVVVSEPGSRTSATPARYAEVAGHFLHAVAVMDAAGEFWAPAASDISAVGISIASGSAGLVANISISASALAQAAGAAGLSADVLLAGSAAAAAAGNAALSAELSMLASGSAEASGSAALTGGAGGDLSAVGGAVAGGSANLVLTVSLSGAGLAEALGAAALSGGAGGDLAGSGGAVAGGAGALVATVSVAAAGAGVASGVAVLDGGAAGELAGSGGAVASGSAQVVATVVLTAAGFVQAMGAGALAVQVPLSAAGGAVASGAGGLLSSDVFVLVRDPVYWVADGRSFRARAPWPRVG